MIKIDFLECSERLGRIRHLGLCLFWLVAPFLLLVLMGKIFSEESGVNTIVFFPVAITAILSLICVKIRRLHDFNWSGCFCRFLYVRDKRQE